MKIWQVTVFIAVPADTNSLSYCITVSDTEGITGQSPVQKCENHITHGKSDNRHDLADDMLREDRGDRGSVVSAYVILAAILTSYSCSSFLM